MKRSYATPSSSFRRPAVSQSRRASANTKTPARASQRLQGPSATPNARPLPALSPRPRLRPAQAPVSTRQPPARQPPIRPPPPPPPPQPLTPSPSRPRARITEMIFCSSIQGRPEWASAVPLLQASRVDPHWKMARLSSHDLTVRIVPEGNIPTGNDAGDTIRFLLISPGEVGQEETTKRLQRFAQRKTDLGGVVIFLLSRGDGEGHNMSAYKKLQTE